jgi:hypothetical protein
MPECTLVGTVVAQEPSSGDLAIAPSSYDGLYLQTEDGRCVRLVSQPMYTQMSVDYMWRQSRRVFEPLLGQRATVQGYLSHSTLYSAFPVQPPVSPRA